MPEMLQDVDQVPNDARRRRMPEVRRAGASKIGDSVSCCERVERQRRQSCGFEPVRSAVGGRASAFRIEGADFCYELVESQRRRNHGFQPVRSAVRRKRLPANNFGLALAGWELGPHRPQVAAPPDR